MMLHMSKAAARGRSPKPSRPSRDTEHALVPIVRDKLQSLGDFAHLLVYRQGDHLFIAHPAPADSPDDVEPVLRITHAGPLALRTVAATPKRPLAARPDRWRDVRGHRRGRQDLRAMARAATRY